MLFQKIFNNKTSVIFVAILVLFSIILESHHYLAHTESITLVKHYENSHNSNDEVEDYHSESTFFSENCEECGYFNPNNFGILHIDSYDATFLEIKKNHELFSYSYLHNTLSLFKPPRFSFL